MQIESASRVRGARALCCALAVLTGLAQAQITQVKAIERDGDIVLDNGLLRVVVAGRSGLITSLRQLVPGHDQELVAQGQALYWDANAETVPPLAGGPRSGYYRPPERAGLARLAQDAPEQAEVVVPITPTAHFPFSGEVHYVMREGLSGLYAYVVLRHGAEQAAARLYQTRFVLRTSADDQIFNHWSAAPGVLKRIPRAEVVGTLSDATFLLADGSVKTKYMNSVYFERTPVYGTLGLAPGFARGVWMIEPSGEYHNGGPVRQGQTFHDDVLLRALQDAHFGAAPVALAAGELWSKVYGPFLIYANSGSDAPALWADAQRQLAQERRRWPYAFVSLPDYAQQRGSVSGSVSLAGQTPQGARVILSDPDPAVDWTAQSRAYAYSTEVGADGRFVIDRVVPGRYALYVDGADQPEDLRQADVEVRAGHNTGLGPLQWASQQSGRLLWQVGRFDRTAAEFRNGQDARDFQMFLRYPQQFPNDVDFTIGHSDPARDWNYAHWSWFTKQPAWHLRFESAAQQGQATLTVGIASAQPAQPSRGRLTQVQLALNGHVLGRIELPKTGTAGYRGGVQDSPHHVLRFAFDASWIQAGPNDLTLQHLDAEPFPETGGTAHPALKRSPGQLMYDALRLEVSP